MLYRSELMRLAAGDGLAVHHTFTRDHWARPRAGWEAEATSRPSAGDSKSSRRSVLSLAAQPMRHGVDKMTASGPIKPVASPEGIAAAGERAAVLEARPIRQSDTALVAD